MDQAAALQFHQEYTYQLAYRMLLRDENPDNRLFSSVDELRRKCTSNDVDWFVALQEKQFTDELLRWRAEARPLILAELAEASGCDRTLPDDEIIATAARKLRAFSEPA